MNLSVIERFLGDTPPFFKKVQALMVVILSGLISIIIKVPSLANNKYLLIVGTAALCVLIICAFAVKTVDQVQSGTPLTIEAFTEGISNVTAGYNEIKDLIKNPPKSATELAADVLKVEAAAGLTTGDQADKQPAASAPSEQPSGPEALR